MPDKISGCFPRGDEGDTAYRYKCGSDLIIDCYSSGGVKYISNITLNTSTYTLDSGIKVGDSKDAVISAYGEPINDGNNILYAFGDKVVYFVLNGDTVSQIQVNFE